jgi:uncharacterized membrane protein YeaQ/YmgE (transglycosylase-associated protein family)
LKDEGINMEQILINLIAGALGGAAVGKSSPKFDLGTIGNIVFGLIGGGLLGPDRYVAAAVGRGCNAGGQSEYWRHNLAGDRRRGWRVHAHGDHWCNEGWGSGRVVW